MPVTVSQIENKEFKVKVRGYDPEEVDAFLDDICDEMIAMQEEIANLQGRLRRQAPAPAAAPIPAPLPVTPAPAAENRSSESAEAAQKLLEHAQKVYDDTVADARREAERILGGAKARQDGDTAALEEEKKRLEEEIDMLKAAARDYRNRFNQLVEDQRHVLSAENALFDD